MTVLVPFARSGSERHPLARFAADSGARWLQRDLNDTDGTIAAAGTASDTAPSQETACA